MDPILTSILASTGAQAGNSIISMIGQRRRERRAMENQMRLMDIHQRNQMALNQQGQRDNIVTGKQIGRAHV